MTHTKKLIVNIVLFLVIAMISVLFARAEYGGICTFVKWSCLDFFDAVAGTVFAYSIGVSVSLFILAFFKKEIFNSWFKFARIFVPIAAVLMVVEIFFYNESNSLGMTGSGSLAFILITTYVVASVVVIVRAHRRLKRGSSTLFPTDTQS